MDDKFLFLIVGSSLFEVNYGHVIHDRKPKSCKCAHPHQTHLRSSRLIVDWAGGVDCLANWPVTLDG